MDRKTVLFVWMFTLVGLSFLLRETSKAGEEANKIQTRERFIITGTLVKEDGAPVTEGAVTLHKAKGSGYTVQADKSGVILNPSSKPDSKGQFKIEAVPEFLGKEREITFTFAYPSGFANQLRDPKTKSPMIIKVHPEAKKLDLGKITVGQ